MAAAVAGTPSLAESASATSIVVTVPSGVVVGELLLATISGPNQTAPTTPPTGWTLLKAQNGNDATANDGTTVFYRVADGSEAASYTFTSGTTANRITGIMLRVSGQDATTPFDATSVSSSAAAAASFTSPSITTVTANALAVYAVSVNAATASDITGPTGPTLVVDTAGTGRRVALYTETIAATGATGTRTWTVTGGATQSTATTLVVRPSTGGGGAPTPTLVQRMVGIPTTTTAVVAAVTTNATSVRLKVGTNTAVTTGVVFGAASTPSASGDTPALTVSGLSPGTRYYYRIAMTDSSSVESLDSAGTVGTFKTAPAGATSFSFCFGSCTNGTDAAVLGNIASRADDLFFHLGDLYYDDGTSTTAAAIRSHFLAKMGAANHAALLATTPTAYTPSDHEAMSNGSTAGNDPTAWTNYNAVYRQLIPAPNIPATTGVYYTFTWGRVRFIVLDDRSFKTITTATDNSSKTALGTTQKQWLKDTITAATEAAIILVQSAPWVGAAVAGDDGWMGYTTERAELASFFAASGKSIFMLGGDMHALAADNGTNAPGGITVFQAAPFTNTSSTKGGPWSVAPYPTTTGVSAQQYGRVQITDTGSTSVTVAFTGYDSTDTARVSLSRTVSTSAPTGGLVATSSDGVLTATVDATTASVKLAVNFAASGSPISGTAATTVYKVTVLGATTAAGLATTAAWPVRGMFTDSAPGGARNGIDHEAPFGTLFYQAMAYDVNGALLATSTSASVTLTSATTYATWLKSLTTPALSVQLDTTEAPQWSWDIPTGALGVIGRSDLVETQDVRQLEAATLSALTLTTTARANLQALLATPGPYLLQLPGYGEPDRFVTVGKVSAQGIGSSPDPIRIWQLPVTRVLRPYPLGWSVAVPGKTYADTQAAAALYSNRTGTYLAKST